MHFFFFADLGAQLFRY